MKNSPKDRHVLAAAIVAGAQVIVTKNLKDFPAESLLPYSIEAQTPDEFLMNLFDDQPDIIAQLVHDQADALRNPRASTHDVVRAIGRDAPHFAELILYGSDID